MGLWCGVHGGIREEGAVWVGVSDIVQCGYVVSRLSMLVWVWSMGVVYGT